MTKPEANVPKLSPDLEYRVEAYVTSAVKTRDRTHRLASKV